MSLLLETSAGYVDSEYSDFEHGHPLSTIKKSSPKFGSDDIQWCINRKLPYAPLTGFQREFSKPIRRLGHLDLAACETDSRCSKTNPSAVKIPGYVGKGTSVVDNRVGCLLDNSYRDDLMSSEFKWWCDEQDVSDVSVSNTCDDVTPIKFLPTPSVLRKKVLNALCSPRCEEQHQLSDRTRCDSVPSDVGEYDDLSNVNMVTKSPRCMSSEHEEWASFMKPVDCDEEVDRLKRQILCRLGLRLGSVGLHEVTSKRDLPRFDVGIQTCDETFDNAYKEYEVNWLRSVNEVLVKKLIEIVNSGKLMACKTEQVFIESLQSYLKRTQNEIDRLLSVYPDCDGIPDDICDDKQDLHEEVSVLKDDNLKLRKEVEMLRARLQHVDSNGPLSDRARILEKRLKEEKTSKKVLMDDFTKTLGYMRMMKDRLKTLSHDKGDRRAHAPDEKTGRMASCEGMSSQKNTNELKDGVLKGCIKRSNTTNCAPSKQDRVKFAETSDVYYLPKRSNSELGPFLADTNKQLPILPCKIGPIEPNDDIQDGGGLMGFFKNIKQTFTAPTKSNSTKVNVLKVPNNQRAQTQQQIDMYKKHLVSRGLNI